MTREEPESLIYIRGFTNLFYVIFSRIRPSNGKSHLSSDLIPANPQSIQKPGDNPKNFQSGSHFLFADLFFYFTFFNAITVHYLRN